MGREKQVERKMNNNQEGKLQIYRERESGIERPRDRERARDRERERVKSQSSWSKPKTL